MASILNAFSSTTRFSARSQTGEAIMNNGTNGSVSPNADTTLGVAQHATVRSKEGWLGAQYSVTLDNNINVKQFNLTTGDVGVDKTPSYAFRDRQITSFFIPKDNVTKNGVDFAAHPVWSGVIITSDNGIDQNGLIRNDSINDFKVALSKSHATIVSSYSTTLTYAETSQPRGAILSLGNAWYDKTL